MSRVLAGVRIAFVLVAVVAAAGSATSNPPPQAMPQQSPYQSPPPAATAQQPQYGPCEYACGQISRCQVSPYATCLDECRRSGSEQQPGGREHLENISRMTCEQVATVMRGGAQPTAGATTTAPATAPATATAPAAPPATTAPPPTAAPPATPPPAATSTPGAASRWVSLKHVSYTNAAMVSADIYLDVTVATDGSLQGSWGRYECLVQTYGIWSCGNSRIEGSARGRLDVNGTGSIELERVGRSSLTWTAKSANEITIELPRQWQGGVLFRSTLKR